MKQVQHCYSLTQTKLWQKTESEIMEIKGKLMDVSVIQSDIKEFGCKQAQLKSDMAQLKSEIISQIKAEFKSKIITIAFQALLSVFKHEKYVLYGFEMKLLKQFHKRKVRRGYNNGFQP